MQRTNLFEAIRPYSPDKRFTIDQVSAIDALADSFGMPRIGTDDWLPYALSLIKQYEGCKLHAYPDPATGGEPVTIGFGATGGIKLGDVWTQQQADTRLAKDVATFGNGVDKLLGDVPATARQKGALVSFAYNIGLANLGSSTLLKLHRAGDYKDAAAQFHRWNKAAGKVMTGLTRRRASEAATYLGETADLSYS